MPFASLKLAAEYLVVENRTINRHLDTKIATSQKVYLFSKELATKKIINRKI
jgi:hypothetical protein